MREISLDGTDRYGLGRPGEVIDHYDTAAPVWMFAFAAAVCTALAAQATPTPVVVVAALASAVSGVLAMAAGYRAYRSPRTEGGETHGRREARAVVVRPVG